MIQILKKLALANKHRTTYQVGLLQAKAYRALKQKTAEILEPYEITTFEWAFLGLLNDNTSLRQKEAAQELGVEPPFVTQMLRSLKTKDFIIEKKDEKDTRVKNIFLTPKGKQFVQDVEPIVRQQIHPLISGITTSEMLDYLMVLAKISKNGGL